MSQDWKRVGRKEREKKKYTLHYRGIDNAREGREGEHADSTCVYTYTRDEEETVNHGREEIERERE